MSYPTLRYLRIIARHLDASKIRHHDVCMRTTLTLDPDVARLLAEEAHRRRSPMKKIVNDALRKGLTGARSSRAMPRYRVPVHHAAIRPGLDRRSMNRLSDEMEDASPAGGGRR